MGGHGAMTIALKNPDRFRRCSAFVPICHPSVSGWSRPAFEKYLGRDGSAWRAYDTCAVIQDGCRLSELLVDQGMTDAFPKDGLRPEDLEAACRTAGI